MITTQNYYDTLKKIDRNKLHADLKAVADLVDEVTNNGNNWILYRQDDEIRETIDLYFAKLSEYLEDQKTESSKPEKQSGSPRKKAVETLVKPKTVSTSKKREKSPEQQSVKPAMHIISRSGQPVERISTELRFIKRFTLLHGKIKTYDQVKAFLNSLQRAIAEKIIRKTSDYAKEIMEVQDSLIKLLGSIRQNGSTQVTISSERLTNLLNICGKQELMLSVRFIKSYIGLQGKVIENTKAKNLYNRVGRAINADRITQKDPYYDVLTDMLNTLESFVKKNPSSGVLMIPSRELNGLQGFVSGLNGFEDDEFDTPPRNVIMDSLDFVKMNFKTIGFKGKWLDFIGNPPPGFMALVAAPAKYGKSILCVEWAAYLARNHGKVLYIAREEGLDLTLQEKLAQAAHENLKVADFIPDNLSEYDFIFFDSITMLQLRPSDIEEIKAEYPNKGLIFISQVNKAGTARGSNEFYHNVDIIIQFPEIGRAVQYGRFNQGGEMSLFN